MNITNLLMVVFIAALCDNVGASQLRGMPNDTKLMDQKLVLGDIVNILGNITGPIIGFLPNNTRPINTTIPTLPNSTSPAPSPEGGLVEFPPSLAPQGEAPLSGGNIVPSLAPEGEASSGTEAPINGGIIEIAPSPLGSDIVGTEPPLSGGIIGVAPSPLGGDIVGTEPPLSGGIIDSPLSPIGTEPPLSDGAIGVPPSLLPIGGGTEPPLIGGIIGIGPPPESGAALATNDIVVSIVFTTNNFGSEDGSNGGSGTKP